MCPACKGLGVKLEVDIGLIVLNPDLSILDSASKYWGDLKKFRQKPNANWMKGEVMVLSLINLVMFVSRSQGFRVVLIIWSPLKLPSLYVRTSNEKPSYVGKTITISMMPSLLTSMTSPELERLKS